MRTDRDPSETFCKEWEILEHSAINGVSPSNLLLQGSEDTTDEEVEWAKGMEDTRRKRPSKSIESI